MMIIHAVKMLTSLDHLGRGVTQHSLEVTIRKRLGETEGHEDKWRFLSGQLKRAKESRWGDISSIWSRVRGFTGDVGVVFTVGPFTPLLLLVSLLVTRISRVTSGGLSFESCVLREGSRGTRSGSVLLNRVALLTLSVWLPNQTSG